MGARAVIDVGKKHSHILRDDNDITSTKLKYTIKLIEANIRILSAAVRSFSQWYSPVA